MEFDVFLSHNSVDKTLVRALARELEKRGLRPWVDEDELVPGRNWQPLMEQGIEQSTSGAVLVGSDGLAPWEDEEMQALLRQAVSSGKPVIPVLLPGAPQQPKLPLFLATRSWVDLRGGFTSTGMDRLVWGVTGQRPAGAASELQAVVSAASTKRSTPGPRMGWGHGIAGFRLLWVGAGLLALLAVALVLTRSEDSVSVQVGTGVGSAKDIEIDGPLIIGGDGRQPEMPPGSTQ